MLSGIFYTIEAVILSLVSFKFWEAYKGKKSRTTFNFFRSIVFEIIFFFFLGLSSLFLINQPGVLKTAFIIAMGFLFLALSFGIRPWAYAKLPKPSQGLLTFSPLFLGSLIIVLYYISPGYPEVNSQGILQWNLPLTSFFLFELMILGYCLALAIEFVAAGKKSPGIRKRSMLTALTLFLIALGSALQIIPKAPEIILLAGHLLLLLAFGLGFMAFFFKDQSSKDYQ